MAQSVKRLPACGRPGWLRQKASARSAGDLGSIPGLGRSPGEGCALASRTWPHEVHSFPSPLEGAPRGPRRRSKRATGGAVIGPEGA